MSPPAMEALVCDSLYVSPHADDVLLSCPARLVEDARRKARIVVITLFAGGSAAWPRDGPLAAAHLRRFGLDLPQARTRSAQYRSFRELAEGHADEDASCLERAAEALTDLAHRSHATQVYAPLGVGGHADHRLAHEAALRAFQSGDGRDVFLYEERPEALVRGAVRARLGEVGARLPPAAAHAADVASLASFLWRSPLAPGLRGDLAGWGDRASAAAVAARQWRRGRAYHPHKGFGPRIQPVVHDPDVAGRPDLEQLLAQLGPAAAAPKVKRLAASYARRLGAGPHAERYWLLLPERAKGGISVQEEALASRPTRPPS